MKVLNPVLSALLALLLGFSFALPSGSALAQQSAAANAAPRIEGFDVEPARQLVGGSSLAFTLYGTPGGTAFARIAGLPGRILLDEVEAGVYEGTYTLKSSDRIVANTSVTANLRLGNQIVTEILDEPLLLGARFPATRAAAKAAPPSLPRIDRFELDAPARLVTGEQLFFTLYGTPESKASLRIAGIKGKLFLEETRKGVYEGTYTIKENGRLAVASKVTANLRLGNQQANAILNRSLLAGTNAVPSARRAAKICANCGVVEAINVVEVKGDGSYVGKIAGGVVGGLLGSQVGQGRGTIAAEIAGVVGGALIGNEIEKRVKKTSQYDVVTRLQDGGTQTVTYTTQPSFKVGDRVKVEGGLLVANP